MEQQENKNGKKGRGTSDLIEGLGVQNNVDVSRVNLVNDMGEEQRDFFLIGLSFFSAYQTQKEINSGKEVSIADKKELEAVKKTLEKYNLNEHLYA